MLILKPKALGLLERLSLNLLIAFSVIESFIKLTTIAIALYMLLEHLPTKKDGLSLFLAY